jgi:peptidoglycan/LPS O-acetylase OafA/YrhL
MQNRLDYLDSIRGLAALLVVIHHTFEAFLIQNGDAYPMLHHLFETINLGRLGVVVFFITSGFVIPWSLKPETPHALKNFAIKRFFRLYPAYWLSIIVASIIGLGFGVNVESIGQILMNFTMIHKFLGVESVIGAYWTLHIELIFYVICAVLFFFGVLKSNKSLILMTVLFSLLAIAAAAVRYYYQIRIPLATPLGLSAMFYGAVLRNYLIDKQIELKVPVILLTAFYFISLFVAQKFYYQEGWAMWYFTQVAAFASFFLLVTKIKLNHSFFVYLGRVSYSLYLFNAVVIGIVFYFLGDFAFTNIGFVSVTILVVVGSILIAELSYRFAEQPGLALSRKFTSKYRKHNNISKVGSNA